jgi:hypothetical protein
VTISLTNVSGRCQVFVLAHETYCEARGACACDHEPGRRARRLPRSLTLASGVTSPELDDAVLTVPDVFRAVRRGEVSVLRLAVVAPAASPAVVQALSRAIPTRTKKKRGA